MPRQPKKPKRKNRKRSADPYVDIVKQLQAANQGEGRLCDCVNDDRNVCDHILQLAVEQLRKFDGDPDDADSFHESKPAQFSTDAPFLHINGRICPSPEREEALWLRIKHGQDTHHPGDRPLDRDNILGSDVVENEEGGDLWD